MADTGRLERPRGIAARAGSWSARHRWAAVGGWVLLVILALAVGSMTGRVDVTESEQVPGESGRVSQILDEAGIDDAAGETVLIQAKGGQGKGGHGKGGQAKSGQAQGGGLTADDPAFRKAVDAVMANVRDTGQVTALRSPYDTKTISADRRSALVQFEMRGDAEKAADHIQPVLDAVDKAGDGHQDLRIEEFGDASGQKAFDDAFGDDFTQAEYSALPVALGILLIVFGALVAALLPVLLAMTAFLATTGLVAMVSHWVHMSDTANSVMLLVGLAVGVDYCLFYLRREREERAAGRDAQTALRVAAATSGRAILVSGVTVIVAMAGMLFTGIAEFKAMGLATLMVVAVAMVGSVTVLPALLSLLGERVEKGRVPFLGRAKRRGGTESRVWRAVLRPVLRRPKLSLALAGGALIALAVPAVGMNTANLTMDQEFGDRLPVVNAYNHIDEAFPGGSDPARVVVKADDIDAAPVRDALARFRTEAVAKGASKGPVEVTVHHKQNLAVVEVPLIGGSDEGKAEKSLDVLRNEVRPATLGAVDGVDAPIGGSTASSKDFNDKLGSAVAPVFAFVVVFAFLLMLMSFRSLTIAVTSIVLNLLSVGAAYGILTAVFQHGWGAGLVGAEGVGAIVSWLPLFLFVILFGLSMDYHVFVVSRIREARLAGRTTKDAVVHGVVTTAGVVTSAAVIMVAVFSIFGTLSMQSMKQMGVGLAAAVLIDATVIRGVLLPAVMSLLGERNWYLPKWLGWLPDLAHDEPAPAPRPSTLVGVSPRPEADERPRHARV
ncbi:MMPL family transporter [Streptomyces rhizosphaericus]|uniref:MMPL family transporter n=1 Tax=Streptomyces rhizosphaericus TaxID=114699 RepID=A0A6G4AGF6_9ACTN|nr:MMPL family transporter [Streptomyces rhizosphaericus]NEW71779.1 MMPL family transporter [Streptomyces rhizosphaericus]